MKKIPTSWMYKPIAIMWKDAIGDRDGWELAKEFSFKEHELALYHVSVGFYIGHSRECVYICQSLREMDKMCAGRMSIPLGCVSAVRRIK